MYCRNCGRWLDDKATRCPTCGTLTGNIDPASTSAPAPKTNTLAIVGFILSILSCFFTPLGVPGLVLSSIGLSRAKKLGGSGKSMAIIGIIVSIAIMLFQVIFLVLGFTMYGAEFLDLLIRFELGI